MVWDVLSAAAALDFSGLVEIFLSNLHWVFVFFALGFIFFEGKNPVRAFMHITVAALFIFTLIPFAGWADITGTFIAFYYVIDLSVLKFAESIPYFARRLIWVEEGIFFGSLVLFNLILA